MSCNMMEKTTLNYSIIHRIQTNFNELCKVWLAVSPCHTIEPLVLYATVLLAANFVTYGPLPTLLKVYFLQKLSNINIFGFILNDIL